jgi:hypothetical protein
MEDPLGTGDYGGDPIIVSKVELVYCDLIGNVFQVVKLAGRKIVYDVDATALGK